MKKILALFLALSLISALCACGVKSDEVLTGGGNVPDPSPAAEDLGEVDDSFPKVGLVCIGGESSGYDRAHIEGLKKAAENVGIPEENLIFKYNVPEDESCYDAVADLIGQGCDIVFTDSYGHQEFAHMAAVDYPNAVVVSMTGDFAGSAGLENFKNASCRTYESCYVSGVVAGMKLAEMVENEALTDANYDDDGNVKLGYVATTADAEVISDYSAFYLGVKSIVENVAMDVLVTDPLYDPAAEASAASAFIADGCCIIAQHSGSSSVPSTVQAAHDGGADVYCVGYNASMLDIAPTAGLTSAACDWSVFYTFALQSMVDGAEIPVDWAEGYESGANYITELGAGCAAGTAEKVSEVETAIAEGSLSVFDCAAFTVDGESPTTFTALDTDGDHIPDSGEAIEEGIFLESTLRSAPYFTLSIDGITVIIADPVPSTEMPS